MATYGSAVINDFYDFMGANLTPGAKNEYCKDVEHICDEIGTTPSALVGDLKQIDDLINEYLNGAKSKEDKSRHGVYSSALKWFKKFADQY